MKVIALTGASSGICRSAALAFGKKGCALGLIARNEQALNEFKIEIEEAGGKAIVITCDVSEPGALKQAADQIEQELGPIDVWVNGAMALVFSKFEDIPFEEFRRVTDVAYHGYVLGTKAALKYMKPRGRGHIIQIGSALSYRSLPFQSAYCGAKHAIRGFTNTLRAELIHEKSDINITMIQFPAINTPLYSWCRLHVNRKPRPQAPVHDPKLAGEAIVWATEHPQRELWVGWIVWLVVLGQKWFPGLSDHIAAKKAWNGQLLDQPPDPNRQDNLYSTVENAQRDEGEFSAEARTRKPLLWHVPMQNLWIDGAGFALVLLAFLIGMWVG